MNATPILTLNTERLTLRPFGTSDADELFQIMRQENLFQYMPDAPYRSRDEALEFIELAQWLYSLDPFQGSFRYFFAIQEKSTSRLVGYCGVGGIDFDRARNELFYGVDPRRWGLGYATEAAWELLDFYFTQLGMDDLIAVCETANLGSQRVMEKIGMLRKPNLHGLPREYAYYENHLVYGLSRVEFSESNRTLIRG
jgi:ribosomal-protein-alanine N-acetyltransferase